MKAIVCTKYGEPGVLQMQEVEKPKPNENEVLIKIRATSVSSGDARIRRADPFVIRLIFGFMKPRKSILGVIFSGEVEAVGKNVSTYKVGDRVYGSTGMNFGTYAEYTCIKEDGIFTIMPSNMTFEEAAAIPFGATASLYFLRKGNVHQGQKILLYGASGSLGTAAVQLAKSFGAEVTGVCSTTNIEMVESLGADSVIDYTKKDFSRHEEKYDVIFDTVGKLSYSDAMRLLNKNGHLLMASASVSLMIRSAITSLFSSKKVSSGVIKSTVSDLKYISKMIESGKMKAVIDKRYSLGQMAAAHAHVDTGHKKGEVVVTIG